MGRGTIGLETGGTGGGAFSVLLDAMMFPPRMQRVRNQNQESDSRIQNQENGSAIAVAVGALMR